MPRQDNYDDIQILNAKEARRQLGITDAAINPIEISTALPKANGTASAGGTGKASDAGHVHPVSTSSSTPTGPAGGDLNGSYPDPTLALTGVVAGTYGSATEVAQVTIDSKGRVTVAADVTIAGTVPAAHAASHENGGADEVSVAGLSGLLADGQTPLAHNTSHENGGGDEISVAGLSGVLADAQNPVAHNTSHENGGGDEISVAGLSGVLNDGQKANVIIETTGGSPTDLTVGSIVDGEFLKRSGNTVISAAAGGSESDPYFYAAVEATNHYTGFPNRTDTTLSLEDAGSSQYRRVKVAGTNFKIWIDGTEHNIATDETIDVTATTGLWWVYYDLVAGVPTLTAETTITYAGGHFGACLVATLYYDSVTGLGILSDERHWMGRDKSDHERWHEGIGALYVSGGTLSATDTTFSVTEVEFYDEDIEHVISGTQTECTVLYKNGSTTWKHIDNSTTLYKIVGGGDKNLQYNNGSTLSTADTAKYVNYWLYATPFVDHDQIAVIIGQAQHNTLALARAESPSSISYGTLPNPEFKLLYKVCYQNKGASTDPDYIEITDYRRVSTAPVQNFVATDHAALTNLGLAASGHTGSSSDLAGVITDETGTGLLVFNNTPTLTTPTIADFTNANHDHLDADDGGTLTLATLSDLAGEPELAYALLGSSVKAQTLWKAHAITQTAALTDKQFWGSVIYLPRAQTLTGGVWRQGVQGDYTANNNNRIGLYSHSGGTWTLVASCADDGNLWKGTASSFQSKAFSSTYAAAAGVYFLALLWCRSAVVAAPTVAGCATASTGVMSVDFTNSNSLVMYINAQTDLPASFAASSTTKTTFPLWVGVY